MNNIVCASKIDLTSSVIKHTLSSYELICCTGGEGAVLTDSAYLPFRDGDIAVIPPLMPHSIESTGYFTNIFIHIDNASFELYEPLILSGDDNNYLTNAFQAVHYFFSGKNIHRSDFLLIYGNLISTFVSSYISSNQKISIAEQIERNILDNYLDPGYDLGTFLRSLPFNYDYITKLFKKAYGKTPNKYLTAKRLQTAAKLLMDNQNHTITETARSCGFHDPLYFSRLFKKYYGISPKLFRPANIDHGEEPQSHEISSGGFSALP